MDKQTKRAQLEALRSIRYAVQRAADHTGEDRHYAELVASIREGERAHMRFGASLLGSRPSRGITREQVVDLFVAKCVLEALKGKAWTRKLEAYSGIRGDYITAAFMVCNARFRENLTKRLTENGTTLKATFATLEACDYAELVK